MSLICSLSGQPATKPLLNPKNGRIYEANLIQSHLLTSQVDPISNDALSFSDLIPIDSSAFTLPPFLTSENSSLSSLLTTLQREYDGVLLERFQLKKEIHGLKQELAHSLYQYDAACRVIARVIKERDEARQMVTKSINSNSNNNETTSSSNTPTLSSPSSVSDNSSSPMETEDGISSSVANVLETTSNELSGPKRKAYIKEEANHVLSKEDLKTIKVEQSFSLHSAAAGISGVSAIDLTRISEDWHKNNIVSGGNDGSIVVLTLNDGKVKHSMKAHKKKVTDLSFIHTSSAETYQQTNTQKNYNPSTLFLSSSQDTTASLWKLSDDLSDSTHVHTSRYHTAPIISLSLHPSSLYAITTATNGSWLCFDLSNFKKIQFNHTNEFTYTNASFHPDGKLLGVTCTDGSVLIYDLAQGARVARFLPLNNQTTDNNNDSSAPSSSAEPFSLSFSGNGYTCATGDDEGQIRLWDLRRVAGRSDKPCNFHTIHTNQNSKNNNSNNNSKEKTIVSTLSFDTSVNYLLAGIGSSVYSFDTKGWNVVQKWNDHKSDITALKVGRGIQHFVTASQDRTVKLWTTTNQEKGK